MPLEVSAYLRNWKRELALKLRVPQQAIEGIFSRGFSGDEELTLRGDDLRFLVVKTATGPKVIEVAELDLARRRLSYVDPSFPDRPRLSSVFPAGDGERPTIHITAFEDEFDRSSDNGKVMGVMRLKINP